MGLGISVRAENLHSGPREGGLVAVAARGSGGSSQDDCPSPAQGAAWKSEVGKTGSSRVSLWPHKCLHTFAELAHIVGTAQTKQAEPAWVLLAVSREAAWLPMYCEL